MTKDSSGRAAPAPIPKRGTWTKWWTNELARRAHLAELKRLRGGRR